MRTQHLLVLCLSLFFIFFISLFVFLLVYFLEMSVTVFIILCCPTFW